MNAATRKVQNTYLLLVLLQSLSESFIWGINTIFLLDAGLSNLQAFTANAFFTVGFVIFEVPTGMVADTYGRRVSCLIGALTLAVSTFCYFLMWHFKGPFWAWALASVALGLGFTFFSGAFQAWLADALTYTGYLREEGTLETVLAKGQIVDGFAMLIGSVAGGLIAQTTHLGVPYIVRSFLLLVTAVSAFFLMHDLGFNPRKGRKPFKEMKRILDESVAQGLANPPVRWVMLAAPFLDGVTFYAFYAMQPYLLELYGNEEAYSVAGLAAATIAGAQIAGGLLVPYLGRLFKKRTSILLAGALSGALMLGVIGLVPEFWTVITSLIIWGLVYSAMMPVRLAYLNNLIGAKERATVLSFDSMLGSVGGVGVQPLLGRVADMWSYPVSYVCGAAIQVIAIPFLLLARRTKVD